MPPLDRMPGNDRSPDWIPSPPAVGVGGRRPVARSGDGGARGAAGRGDRRCAWRPARVPGDPGPGRPRRRWRRVDRRRRGPGPARRSDRPRPLDAGNPRVRDGPRRAGGKSRRPGGGASGQSRGHEHGGRPALRGARELHRVRRRRVGKAAHGRLGSGRRAAQEPRASARAAGSADRPGGAAEMACRASPGTSSRGRRSVRTARTAAGCAVARVCAGKGQRVPARRSLALPGRAAREPGPARARGPRGLRRGPKLFVARDSSSRSSTWRRRSGLCARSSRPSTRRSRPRAPSGARSTSVFWNGTSGR